MYYVIGLSRAGRMSLWDSYEELPTDADLEEELGSSGYVQVLVIEDNSQLARYEYDCSPRLKRIETF